MRRGRPLRMAAACAACMAALLLCSCGGNSAAGDAGGAQAGGPPPGWAAGTEADAGQDRGDWGPPAPAPSGNGLKGAVPHRADWPLMPQIPPEAIGTAALMEDAPGSIGVLCFPDAGILLPVMQGEDNSFYLHHGPGGGEDAKGSIFMDAGDPPSPVARNCFVYGHNMRDGSMFGSLKKLIAGDRAARSPMHFFFIGEDRAWAYSVYSLHVEEPGSASFVYTDTDGSYEEWQGMVLDSSVPGLQGWAPGPLPTMTLSTCSGAGESKKRLLVHGGLVGVSPLPEGDAPECMPGGGRPGQ